MKNSDNEFGSNDVNVSQITNLSILVSQTKNATDKMNRQRHGMHAVNFIYIWSEKSSVKSEPSFVLTAQTRTIERDWN